MERSWKKSKPSSSGWIAPHAVHTKNGDASSLLSHDQHFFSNSNTGVLENSLSNFPLVSRLLHYIPKNKPEILQMFSPIVREPWIAWHNKNILVINERWRLNPQHFSNVRETQTHELPDLIEILVINREMEQLEFQIHFFPVPKSLPPLCCMDAWIVQSPGWEYLLYSTRCALILLVESKEASAPWRRSEQTGVKSSLSLDPTWSKRRRRRRKTSRCRKIEPFPQ